MIDKITRHNNISEFIEKINEIIDTINSMSPTLRASMPLNNTWMPGSVVDDDIDPIFFQVYTPPVIKSVNLISELEDRLCR